MGVFRPKPTEATVNAVRWGPDNDDRLRVLGWLDANGIQVVPGDGGIFLVVPGEATLRNQLPLPEGWWIVRRDDAGEGSGFEFLTMTHMEFCRTYEAVPEA